MNREELEKENLVVGIITLIVVISIFLYASMSDSEASLEAESDYCEMVTMHIDSDGALGWPDYKGIYSNACIGDRG
jgi:hypothetical protein